MAARRLTTTHSGMVTCHTLVLVDRPLTGGRLCDILGPGQSSALTTAFGEGIAATHREGVLIPCGYGVVDLLEAQVGR